MGGHISWHIFLAVVGVDEAIKNVDQVLWVLEIVLNSDVVCDSNTSILEDTIKMCKTVGDELIVRFHVFDDIKESSNDSLSLLFLLYPFQIMCEKR